MAEKPDEGFSGDNENYLPINSEHKEGPLGKMGRVPNAYPNKDEQNDTHVEINH